MIKLKDLILEDIYRYFYHATLNKNLPSIATQGLIPSENQNWGGELGAFSRGKVFVTDRFRTANYYGNVLWRDDLIQYRPILRFKYNKLNLASDKQSDHDFFVKVPIKTQFEIFVYSENTKIERERNGDTWFVEATGRWKLFTKDLADSIASGEWDEEFIDDNI